MMEDPRAARIRRNVMAIMVVYMVPAFILAMYQGIEGTGLSGWMLAEQLDILGFASTKLAVMLAWMAYCIPLFIAGIVWEKAAPEQLAAYRQAYFEQKAASANTDQRPIKTWKGVFILTGVMLLVAGAISGFVYWQDNRPAGDVHAIEFSGLADARRYSGMLVEVSGVVPRGVAYAYREGEQHHVYVPLTEKGWTRTQPVAVFVHFEGPERRRRFRMRSGILRARE